MKPKILLYNTLKNFVEWGFILFLIIMAFVKNTTVLQIGFVVFCILIFIVRTINLLFLKTYIKLLFRIFLLLLLLIILIIACLCMYEILAFKYFIIVGIIFLIPYLIYIIFEFKHDKKDMQKK